MVQRCSVIAKDNLSLINKLFVCKRLTFLRLRVEQLLLKSNEHSLKVNQSTIPSATVADDDDPKFDIVFNNVMYVPPKRGSLIREKKAIEDSIMM